MTDTTQRDPARIRLVNLAPQWFDAMVQLQYDCYPTIDESEYFRREHFESQYRIFPEGVFIALDGDRAVGFGSGLFLDFDFEHPDHKSHEITADGYYTTHQPDGAYYYGTDIGVHPDYRGWGIGSMLYKVRKALAQRYQRRGIIAVGILPGYAQHRHLDVHTYVDQVIAGELFDNTLSFQLKNGFKVKGLIENYVEDSASGNWGVLIFWENPEVTSQSE